MGNKGFSLNSDNMYRYLEVMTHILASFINELAALLISSTKLGCFYYSTNQLQISIQLEQKFHVNTQLKN